MLSRVVLDAACRSERQCQPSDRAALLEGQRHVGAEQKPLRTASKRAKVVLDPIARNQRRKHKYTREASPVHSHTVPGTGHW